jgi:hypothetical protein
VPEQPAEGQAVRNTRRSHLEPSLQDRRGGTITCHVMVPA